MSTDALRLTDAEKVAGRWTAVLGRVSSERQAGNGESGSVLGQVRDCVRVCGEQGWRYAIYTDIGSGADPTSYGDWLTPQEAADYLRTSRQSIVRWTQQGRIPKYHVPPRFTRYKRSDLDAYLERHRVRAGDAPLPLADSPGDGDQKRLLGGVRNSPPPKTFEVPPDV